MKAISQIVVFLCTGLICHAQTDTIKVNPVDTSFYQKMNEQKTKKEIKKEDDHNFWIGKNKNGSKSKFKGHWAGVELGINRYLNKNKGLDISGKDEFMNLRTTRSLNFNLNFFKWSGGIVSDRLGLVSGMGIEWYNYFFSNNNSIARDSTGVIVPRYYSGINLDKSKLTNMFLSVPLLLEFNLFNEKSSSKRLHIAAGVVGALLVSSHAKVVYYVNGDKRKEKDWGNLNINYLRYSFTTRIGYDKMSLYGTYSPVPLFQKNKGPELYPFSMGLSFGF